MRLMDQFSSGSKKKQRKTSITRQKMGLQLRINTHSVGNFVAYNVKIKYVRNAFE